MTMQSSNSEPFFFEAQTLGTYALCSISNTTRQRWVFGTCWADLYHATIGFFCHDEG
jgi:hypothetical protein